MNKLRILLIVSIITFLSNFHLASQSMNNIALWGSGGYSTFLTPSDNVFTKGNLGGDIGVGYELHYKRFLFQTGVEFGYYAARLGMDDFLHYADMIDTEGDEYIGNFLFTENIDKYTFGNINIPIMFGIQTRSIYFMFGGKLGINVLGNSSVRNELTTAATYDRFIENFEDMPNHDLTTFSQNYDYPLDFNINFSLSGEVGIYLGGAYKASGKPKYRLSLYADYGLLSIHNKSKKADLLLNKRDEPYYLPGLNSYMLANPLIDKNVNTLYAGLKFTIIFQINDKRDCLCDKYLSPDGLFEGIPWVGN